MSPEQADGDDVDRRTDVFALGVVLWEAVVGERLFATDHPARTLLRVREHRPKSPAEIRPEVGTELAEIILRCLAKEPSRRYESAAELAEALRQVLRTRGTPVDESDLGFLVQRLFASERKDFLTRVRTGAARWSARAERFSGDGGPESSELSKIGRPRPVPPALRVSLRRFAIVGLAAAFGGGGLVAWWSMGRGSAQPSILAPETKASSVAAPDSSRPSPQLAPAPPDIPSERPMTATPVSSPPRTPPSRPRVAPAAPKTKQGAVPVVDPSSPFQTL
jgi:serine/threonine-protein kinase